MKRSTMAGQLVWLLCSMWPNPALKRTASSCRLPWFVRCSNGVRSDVKKLNQSDQVLAVKDETGEQPIPTAWRKTLREIVDAFVIGDYRLDKGVAGVEPVSADTASHIWSYLKDYGATLIALPEATWNSSVCIWYGDYWNALVDLWTQEEGRSDLVLDVRVTEAGTGFRIEVHLVYVP